MKKVLEIGGRKYTEGARGFRVPLSNLHKYPLGLIPAHSTIEITGLPLSKGYKFSIRVTNGGDPGEDAFLTVFGFVGCLRGPDSGSRMRRIRREALPFLDRGELPDPLVFPVKLKDRFENGAGFSIDCEGKPQMPILDAVRPLLSLYHQLAGTSGSVFLCHASEDKPAALRLATLLRSHGVAVWLDQWEIRVGDSIVEKVNSGLESSSHLAILISKTSISKPWVTRELSAALMRQLADRSILVLPVRLDDSPIPPLLADIKYADCRSDFEDGTMGILEAVANSTPPQETPNQAL